MTSVLGSIPTRLFYGGAARQVADTQSELARLQTELSTGRHFDGGLVNGRQASERIALETRVANIETQQRTNALYGERVQVQQAALSSILEAAHSASGDIIGSRSATGGAERLATFGANALSDLLNRVNADMAGAFVFGGENSDQPPFPGANPESALVDAVRTAFEDRFGFPPGAPPTSAINEADFSDFLQNDLASVFSPASWSGLTSASADGASMLIGDGRQVRTGVTADDASIRLLAGAYAKMAALSGAGLSDAVHERFADHMLQTMAEGVSALTRAQSLVGAAEGRLSMVGDDLVRDLDLANGALTSLEQVDPFKVTTRINTLLTSLETSYALTARLQNMSLINYLR